MRVHRRRSRTRAFEIALCLFAILLTAGCGGSAAPSAEKPPEKLSAYSLFAGDPVEQRPAEGVIPYALNSPLFSDYAAKFRFVKLPPGTQVAYQPTEVFEFPIGTVIAKTFAYPHDMNDPEAGQRLLETRILLHEPDGWVGLPYIWNEEQTEATLKVAGGVTHVSWVHADGQTRELDYLIPNKNQCKGCHKHRDKTMLPIGPKAGQLNGDFVYEHGVENQLAHWRSVGALAGAPEPAEAPKHAVWHNAESGSLDARARAYLEANCAHCHNPRGPARNSGLNLLATAERPYEFGVFKAPVAAGAGSGGRPYDIVPGRPDESIMLFRMESTHPGVMMPELGKRLVHDEGVELIREWIAAMPTTDTAQAN